MLSVTKVNDYSIRISFAYDIAKYIKQITVSQAGAGITKHLTYKPTGVVVENYTEYNIWRADGAITDAAEWDTPGNFRIKIDY